MIPRIGSSYLTTMLPEEVKLLRKKESYCQERDRLKGRAKLQGIRASVSALADFGSN